MKLIGSLIRFIFNTTLVLLGSVAVVFIAASLYAGNVNGGDSRVVIENGPLRGRAPASLDARALYPVLQARASEINTPISNNPGPVTFTIQPGEAAFTVAQNLQEMKLISDARLFAQLLHYNGIDIRLAPGSYQLRRNMTMKEIGAALYRGYNAQTVVTVPPGWRMEQLAQHLADTGLMDGNLFLEQARQGAVVNHYLLADHPPGQSYEGYLFPGTYRLPENATPQNLIAQMLENMADQLPANAFSLARQQGLTFHQVLTLASIVERETALAKERPLVASVYLNRLSPQSPYPHLQADPTVQYAMGYQPDTGQWWKTPVTLEEYPLVDSPYNTYLYPGLPPGPIASPGLDSIMAVLNPASTNYFFFVCRHPGCKGGEHVFAPTYQEHLQNVANYWEQ